MKKQIIIACILFSLTLISCSPSVVRRKRKILDTSWANIQVNGTLKVGVIDYFPPYVTHNPLGKHAGFDVNLAYAVANKLNIKLEIIPIDWDQKKTLLYSKKIDCIWSAFSITDSRKSLYNFTQPYIRSSQVIVVRKDSQYKSVAEISSKKIGGIKGSSNEYAANIAHRKYGNFRDVKEYTDFNEMIDSLQSGEVEAAFVDILLMFYLSNSELSLRILPEAIMVEEYGIAFRNGENELKKKVVEALLQLENEGVVEQISKKWFSSNICLIGR